MASLFQEHVARWRDCRLCPLCRTRRRVVLARGQVPCDALFIGEAPGASEDVIGRPFVGPAGKLLDQLIKRALPVDPDNGGELPQVKSGLRLAFTNLVACIPLGEDGAKTAEPSREAIKDCAPRLVEFIRIARPRLLVLVGALAKRWMIGDARAAGAAHFRLAEWIEPDGELMLAEIDHPAAILRMNEIHRGLACQRCVVRLADAFESL